MKKFFTFLCFFSVFLSIVSCQKEDEGTVVTDLDLNKSSINVEVGKSERLVATVETNDASIVEVVWSTSDAAIATVDKDGVVTGVKVGEATITAVAGKMVAKCSVTVVEAVVPYGWYLEGKSSGNFSIATAKEFAEFANVVNGSLKAAPEGVVKDNFEGKTITLTADINMSSVIYKAIGFAEAVAFAGLFDGNGKNISGIAINSSNDCQGLFGCNVGTIKNVTVEGSVEGKNHVGGICGSNSGTISNCKNKCLVKSQYSNLGGVCGGCYDGRIVDCVNEAAVNSDGYFAGGVCGYSVRSTITGCKNLANVSISSDTAGGICGSSQYSDFAFCLNSGEVSSATGFIGGIVGYSSFNNVLNCSNDGKIGENNDTPGMRNDAVGGICGYNVETLMSNCYNEGTILGGYFIGGISGKNNKGTIVNSYNVGAVAGTKTYVGSLCGKNEDGFIDYSYYLVGSAIDGMQTTQNGVGLNTLGSSLPDVESKTEAKSDSELKSADFVTLLNKNRGDKSAEWTASEGGYPTWSRK